MFLGNPTFESMESLLRKKLEELAKIQGISVSKNAKLMYINWENLAIL